MCSKVYAINNKNSKFLNSIYILKREGRGGRKDRKREQGGKYKVGWGVGAGQGRKRNKKKEIQGHKYVGRKERHVEEIQ